MEISGRTRIMLMLCDPVHHIRGSVLLNSWLEDEGIDAVINPINVVPDDLGAVLDAVRLMRNLAGIGVTIPHKVAVTDHLDQLTDIAQIIGSVNFVRREESGRLVGTNIDGEGFIRGCEARGISMRGKRVLHLGAGGAGRATAFASAGSGAARLELWNRTRSRAERLAEEITAVFPEVECAAVDSIDLAGHDVLINATPAGMEGFAPLDIDLSNASPDLAVADIIVNPSVTPLLAQAEALGLVASNGADMLRGQYELMRDFIGLRS